jgi:hypothetical protein
LSGVDAGGELADGVGWSLWVGVFAAKREAHLSDLRREVSRIRKAKGLFALLRGRVAWGRIYLSMQSTSNVAEQLIRTLVRAWYSCTRQSRTLCEAG